MTVSTLPRSRNETTPLLQADAAAPGHMLSGGTSTDPHSVAGDGDDDALPLAIAHRGYCAVAPENSMLAFRKAAEVGAHAIETDLHLSRDGVVVLTHDFSLKRTFGLDSNVSEHDWSILSTLRTVREPHEPMIRLVDLLAWLNEPGQEHIWLMLDIKRDDNAEDLMRRTAAAIASVPTAKDQKQGWSDRIMLCCWTATYIRLSRQYLPGFPLANVTWSPFYAGAIAKAVPGVALSVHRLALYSPFGQLLMRRLQRSGSRHPVYSWTINEESWMEWAIRRRLDGIITDDPRLFLEVCERHRRERGNLLRRARRRFSLHNTWQGVHAWYEVLYFVWAFFVGKLVVMKQAFDPRVVHRDLNGG
ncbi:PLC-like phosphodiesterase [Microdochium bolleyi]|uniref:PLC-like phosphodiesterase n=1 Tax=Microdochium bolleyi TaxID=196109 RepID=A0A136J1E4_9PEZI|nr:PLC-like phosphodiesterase [Microdochium bolleyi]